jgi:uncharacterized repeat protein (TIGR01451 family)
VRLGASVLVVATALLAQGAKAAEPPAGLTREDWRQIRGSIVHEAQLFGHADSGGPDAEFGYSVAVSGDTAVIGAPRQSVPAVAHQGAAYVFVRSGTSWALQQKLTASDGATNDEFGYAVSISGDTVVVGAWMDDTAAGGSAGSAYVFVRAGNTWTEQQKLLPSDGGIFDVFGCAVSVSGDTAAVGAFRADSPGPDAGAAYIFVRSGTTWTQQQKLVASDGFNGDRFGNALSLSGDTVVVGAYTGGFGNGAAYVFVRSGAAWSEQQKLTASDGALNDVFGSGVAVAGDTAVVGAYLDDSFAAGQDSGSAYVFVRSGTVWTQQQKLVAPDGATGDWFGWSVSLAGDTAVVGARLEDNSGGADAGSAYVFVRSGTAWSQQQKLLAPGGAFADSFGVSVSISGETVLAGAPFDNVGNVVDEGSAHVFVRSGTVWTAQQTLTSLDGTAYDAFGFSVSVSGNTAVIGAVGDAARGSAYVFVRTSGAWTEQQKLVASDATSGHAFGHAVSVSGDTVVVGDWLDDDNGFSSGSAYVFARSGTTWTQQQKLLASDGAPFDSFGFAVAVSEDTVIVGAPADDHAGGDGAGSAYVFVRSGTIWTQQQKLVASDASLDDSYGWTVALSGDTAVIGAPVDDTSGGTNAGSAYVSVRSGTTWTEQQKLTAADGAALDAFGNSVAASADTAVVGAPGVGIPGVWDTGAVYVFVRSGTAWSQEQKLMASDGQIGDIFGLSVAVWGEVLVAGSRADIQIAGSDEGAAYVFTRSGTTWTEQEKLLAPDPLPGDDFGGAVAVDGSTILVGTARDDTPGGLESGSAHVFRRPEADLAVTKTDGQATAVPGEPLTYTLVVSNGGPAAATAASVTDVLPAALLAPTWTCVASAGSSCTAGGSGNIADLVTLAAGGTATYVVTGTVSAGATGTLANTATVTPPAGLPDPNPANNSATDIDTLTPEVDLAVTKTDSADPVSPGDPLTYTVTVTNAGPSHGTGVTLADTLPAGVTFVSSSPGPPACAFAGGTLTCSLGALAAGASATVTIDVTVNAGSGMLVNTASASANETDPDPGNNSGSAATVVGRTDGELAHGSDAVYDLAAAPGPVPDEDVFRIEQKPYSSYEVVVDATSGDIGAGNGPVLERVAADGTTVVQGSIAVGVGFARSLRWRNSTAGEVEAETVRVRSAGCGTDCGPDDVYRIRVYETTGSIPRFNNAGTQVTVLVLQNPTNGTIAGAAYFRIPTGGLVATHSFSLGPKQALVVNTAAIPGANGVSGAITVAHDGRYAELSGKTVALEPSTGFSFDSPLVPRIR